MPETEAQRYRVAGEADAAEEAERRRHASANRVLTILKAALNRAWQVRALIREYQPVVVFLDTVARAFPGLRENDGDSMGRVVAAAWELKEDACRPAIITVHHVAKDAGTTPRGHAPGGDRVRQLARLDPQQRWSG